VIKRRSYKASGGGMSAEVTEIRQKPISICGWLGTIVVAFVPFINVIVLSYWSLSRKTDPNRKNFSIAGLIAIAIWIAVILAIFIYMYAASDPSKRIRPFVPLDY
jgi:hypothetical protein